MSPIESYVVTEAEQLRAPFRWCADPWSILFNGPIMFGRGIQPPGPADSWEAWRDFNGNTHVHIRRGPQNDESRPSARVDGSRRNATTPNQLSALTTTSDRADGAHDRHP